MRARWYPTGHAVVFREPTLAWLMAALRTDTIRNIALIALSLAVFIALRDALARTAIDARLRYTALPLIATGIGVAWLPGPAYNMHEIWTGFLIALSLALYRPDRWSLSIALGVTGPSDPGTGASLSRRNGGIGAVRAPLPGTGRLDSRDCCFRRIFRLASLGRGNVYGPAILFRMAGFTPAAGHSCSKPQSGISSLPSPRTGSRRRWCALH